MIRLIQKLETESKTATTLTLLWEQRIRSRLRVILDNGKDAGIFMEKGTVLKSNDVLMADDGYLVRIVAAEENVSTVKGGNALDMARACYHLGNRHTPLQITENELRYLHDPVLDDMIRQGRLQFDQGKLKDTRITYHDPCYLGRANDIYDEPRNVLGSLGVNFIEMKRNRSLALCCGAGGAQMFKEAEKGDKEIFIERIEDALETNAEIVATACPFCMTMITDGLKYKNKEETIKNYDIAELIVQSLDI